jgi:protein-tyrosine phosphatase
MFAHGSRVGFSVTRVTAAQHLPAWLDLTGAYNVRDLGGLPAAGGTVRPRVLLRGDNLDGLTATDVALLRDDVGLRGVVDLRAAFERPRAAEWFPELGITWLHEPLVDFTGLTDPTAARGRIGNDYTSFYAYMLEASGPGLVRILSFLVEGEQTPALVHCAAGKDRTGIVTSILLAVAGVERTAIVADYLATGERIAAVRAALSQREEYRHLRERSASDATSGQAGEAGADAGLGSAFKIDERAIVSVLDTVEATPGGAAGFLVANGATNAQIDRWREMIIDPA